MKAEEYWEAEYANHRAYSQGFAAGCKQAQQEARAERDAVWADAIGKLSDDCDVECIRRHNDCDDAAPLRALLEGK